MYSLSVAGHRGSRQNCRGLKRVQLLRGAVTAIILFSFMLRKMSWALVALLAGICTAASQIYSAPHDTEWSARVWQLDDGLPDNRVTGIAQTPDHYLWLATQSGLARFDGVRFQNIVLPIPSGRTRPLIRTMLLGRENRLWLALEGGLVVSLARDGANLFTPTNGLPQREAHRDGARFAKRRVDRLRRWQRKPHRAWGRDPARRRRFGKQRAVQSDD